MRKNISLSLVVCIVLAGLWVFPVFGEEGEEIESRQESGSRGGARGNTLYVGGSGAGNYSSIEDAIDNANTGDTVFVYEGIYEEDELFIYKSINLVGENRNNTIIVGEGYDDPWGDPASTYVVVIIGIGCNYVNISGFTLTNRSYGINLCNANNCSFNDLYFKDIQVGINYSGGWNDNNVISNSLFLNVSTGVAMWYTSNNNTQIINNTFISKRENNWYDGKCALYVMTSDNSNIISNTFINDYRGIFLKGSIGNKIMNNTFVNNVHGIHMVNWDWISRNSTNNSIIKNYFTTNDCGIYIENASNNHIFSNNFINNSIQSYDNIGTNFWNSTYPTGGNYWSDWTSPDNNSDGIVDLPYNISGGAGAKDYLPLTNATKNVTWLLPNPSGRVINMGTGLRYSTIQNAVDAAFTGDTIRVWSGTYYENIVIDKQLTLKGNGSVNTIIDGKCLGHVITIYASLCDISGFSITNSTSSANIRNVGIMIESDGCKLFELNCSYKNYYGIYILNSNNTTISKCDIYSNYGSGINISMSKQNYLANCTFISNLFGITIQNSENNFLEFNYFYSNDYGIYFDNSNNNKLIYNIFKNQIYQAVFIWTSSYNLLYFNDFIDNYQGGLVTDVKDNGWNNDWNSTNKGNYWSDWTSPDNNGDGIVDNPYLIDGSASTKDFYPLVNPSRGDVLSPRIITNNVQSAYVGALYSVNYTATDLDTPQNELIWTMNTNTSWLTFSSTQELSGTPTISDIGSYWVYISVSDGNNSDETNFTLTVTRKPQPPQPPQPPQSNGTVIIVRTGQKFKKIQDAVDNAINNDIILVYDGEYKENIVVNKEIKIISKNGSSKTTIIPKVANSPAIKIISNNVTIEGFTIKGLQLSNTSADRDKRKYSAIYIESAFYCNITSNNIDNFYTCIIIGSNVSSSPITTSRYNVVYNNDVSDFFRFGILVIPQQRSTWGSLNGKSTTNTNVINNRIRSGSWGIYLMGDGNIIIGNNISNCDFGIDLDSSHFNQIKKNNIINNYKHYGRGISLRIASNNTITENIIMDNKVGINLEYTIDNLIYLNEFSKNVDNARSDDREETLNTGDGNWRTFTNKNDWNSTKKIKYTYKGKNFTDYLGNFWSNWTSPDNDDDGIVDKPYIINQSSFSKDFHPLVHSMGAGITQSPPTITTSNVLTAYVNQKYSVNYTATDPDTPIMNLIWSMKTNASWLNFSSSQELFGTPTTSDIGTYWVYIEVTDGLGKDHTNFTLRVQTTPLQNITNPVIKGTTPGANSRNVSVNNSQVIITFSKSMNRSSVEAALSIYPSVNYSIYWGKNDTELLIIFNEQLAYNTTYRITISTSAKDIFGNNLRDQLRLEFTTEAQSDHVDVDEDKEKTDDDFVLDAFAIIGIIISLVIIIILILTFFIMINKKRKQEKKETDEKDFAGRTEIGAGIIADEYKFPKDFQHDHDVIIKELKKGALKPNKPSDFGISKEEMVKKFRKKFENAEISKETYNSIKGSILYQKK